MLKIDLKKDLTHLYNPGPKVFSVVDVPPMNFLMIDGSGDPNTSKAYQEAVETLFGLSYALKFMVKKSTGSIDYAVMPLEGLWWVDDMTQFSIEDKSVWQWTAIMMQPEYVTNDLVTRALDETAKKKALPALNKVRFESFHEGLAVQIMHIGPFSAEGPTIARMHDYIKEQGFTIFGKHHEIYLSDFRRTAPAKLKTVIRQPFQKPA